jgi:type I restriction enzyme S subunit
MNRWPTKPLSDVAQVTAGDPAPQRPEDFAEDGVPFVRMQDVGRLGQSTCLAETKDRLSPLASARLKRFPAGSILVPKSGASIRLNHRAILGIEAHVVSHLAVIVPRPLLNTHFAYYWLCGTDLSGVAHQADLPSMKTSDLARLQLPVPPLAEQERIVRLLDESDELRKLRAQADRRTDALIPALFHDMFGDPDTNPFGWPVTRAGDLMDACDYGTSQKANKEGRGIPVLRMGNVTTDGSLDLEELKTVELADSELAKQRLQVGDVLFNRTNSRELVGKTGMWDGRFEAVPASYFIRVRFRPNAEHPQHFTTFMNLPSMKRRLAEMARGAVGQANINSKELKSIEFPVPPVKLQCEFAARVREIRAMEAEQATSRSRLENLFQSMLHRAFQGEL